MSIWVICEDFARAAIGPFESDEAANEHIRYITARGDRGAGDVYHFIGDQPDPNVGQHFCMTPEKDKKGDDTCPMCGHFPRFGCGSEEPWCAKCAGSGIVEPLVRFG